MASRLLRVGNILGNRMKHALRREAKVIQPIPTWNIVKGDRVQILEGKDKGKQGYVLECVRDKSAVVLKGLKLHPRSYKINPNEKGRHRFMREALIHYSNVQLVDPITAKPTRVRRRRDANGAIVRVSKSGAIIPKRCRRKLKIRPANRATDTPVDAVRAVTYVKPDYSLYGL